MFRRMFGRMRVMPRKIRIIILIPLVVIVILTPLIWAGYQAGWTGFSDQTLWNWMQLLIIPAVLGVGALLFQMAERRAERENRLERQRQETLRTYFDRMSDLLIKENLRNAKEDSEARIVARARTVSALRSLDGQRIAQLIQFLTESNLGGDTLLTIDLYQADLQKAHFGAVNLQRADLGEANLTYATVTPTRLSTAKSLDNATMPDGTKYEEWIARGSPDWNQRTAKRQKADKPRKKGSESQDKT